MKGDAKLWRGQSSRPNLGEKISLRNVAACDDIKPNQALDDVRPNKAADEVGLDQEVDGLCP